MACIKQLMKSITYSAGMLLAGLCLSLSANADDRYIIKYKQGWDGNSTPTTLMNLSERKVRSHHNSEHIRRHGGRVKRILERTNSIAAELSPAQLSKLKKSANVEFVEIDPIRFLPLPLTTPQKRNLDDEETPYGITMVQADQLSEGANTIKICITDTGYDGDHEDLRSYLNNMSGNDNNGAGGDSGNWWEDGHGHGTHVAGTISALGNKVGVVGVNSRNKIGLHIVKVFNDSGSWVYGSDMVIAVEECVTAGANIISMSLGGDSSSTAENNAFQSAYDSGVLLIAAAGNNGSYGGNDAYSYPASYTSVMSVAAIDSAKVVSSWSQKNSQVEIAAPGVAVTSTIPDNEYATWSGTSMATPHVSGLAALVWSHYPNCNNHDIRNAINASAEDLGSAGRDQRYGYGLALAKNAYDHLNANPCGVAEPIITELVNGAIVDSLASEVGENQYFVIAIPDGAVNFKAMSFGGSGDLDLYLRKETQPTISNFDCRPYLPGNDEVCEVVNPDKANYYIMLHAYKAYSGASLTVNYDDAGSWTPPEGNFEYPDLSANRRAWLSYTVEVPAGMDMLDINIAGGTGDAELYVRFGSKPSKRHYDCRPRINGNVEKCHFDNPSAGVWHIRIRVRKAFSGVTLSGNYQ